MQAIRFHDSGDTAELHFESVTRPAPTERELLVRVEAAGVNTIDWLVRNGALADLLDDPFPWIPGWDLSGVVEAVGSEVDEYDPGDEVFGMVQLPDGGTTWAEYTTVRPAEVAAKPTTLSHVEAAGVPMTATTAWHALFEVADLGADDRVLVHAAAGGVGHFAVQLATLVDAHVIGTASGGNEAYLRDLGVDEFVDYRETAFEDVVDPVDVVLDAVGGDVLERSAEVTVDGGVIVTLPTEPPPERVERLQREYGVEPRFFSVTVDADPATLESVREHVESGAVEPTISGVYPLSRAAAALAESEAGHVRGKLVLDVPGAE